MKRVLVASLYLFCAFLGGAVAQTLLFSGAAIAAIEWTTNLIYAGQSAPGNSAFWALFNISGTASTGNADGITAPMNLYIPSDTVDTTTSGYGGLSAMSVKDVVETNHTGGRQAILGYSWVKGTPAATPGAAGYVGITSLNFCNANLTGATGAYTNYKGGCFGGNSNVFTAAAATFINRLDGHEHDITLASGSSAADKYGISIVQGADDAVRGAYDDAAINISSQAASTTWTTGLEFGSYAHQWAFGSDSTLIGVKQRQAPSTDTPTALYGIDFSALTLAAGGAPIVVPLLTPASSSEACKAGSIKWDASFIYICTATNTWKRATLASF